MRESAMSATPSSSRGCDLPTSTLDSKLIRILEAVLLFQVRFFQEFRGFHFGPVYAVLASVESGH